MARTFVAFNGAALTTGLTFRNAAKLHRAGCYVTGTDTWRRDLRTHGIYRLVETAGRFTPERYHHADLTAACAEWAVRCGWGTRAERQRVG